MAVTLRLAVIDAGPRGYLALCQIDLFGKCNGRENRNVTYCMVFVTAWSSSDSGKLGSRQPNSEFVHDFRTILKLFSDINIPTYFFNNHCFTV